MLTQKQIDAIKDRHQSTTQTKWSHGNESGGGHIMRPILDANGQHTANGVCVFAKNAGEIAVATLSENDHKIPAEVMANAVFISHAHEDIPALLKHIEDLHSLITEAILSLANTAKLAK